MNQSVGNTQLQLAFAVKIIVETFCLVLCQYKEQEDEEANTGSHMKLIVDAFIQQLPNCVNRDLIDKVSTCTVSTCRL